MPIHIGTSSNTQKQITLGSTQMQRVYVGDKLVWKKNIISTTSFQLEFVDINAIQIETIEWVWDESGEYQYPEYSFKQLNPNSVDDWMLFLGPDQITISSVSVSNNTVTINFTQFSSLYVNDNSGFITAFDLNNCLDVLGIEIYGSSISEIPYPLPPNILNIYVGNASTINFSHKLPNSIWAIQLVRCGITSIPNNSFLPDNLTSLGLYGNLITGIDNVITAPITVLGLQQNRITEINFANLPNTIEQLYLTYNFMTTAALDNLIIYLMDTSHMPNFKRLSVNQQAFGFSPTPSIISAFRAARPTVNIYT